MLRAESTKGVGGGDNCLVAIAILDGKLSVCVQQLTDESIIGQEIVQCKINEAKYEKISSKLLVSPFVVALYSLPTPRFLRKPRAIECSTICGRQHLPNKRGHYGNNSTLDRPVWYVISR